MNRKSWKRQTFWSLPVYTGDVSGVCSALYELGGMVVMHDPSGCNSTYNTHDEIRWMDQESLIFLSGLKDIDAITGNDRKLIDDIVETAAEFHPKFIAIANSPVPWLIGTDFRSICRTLHRETGIPAFHVETNAMHDYTYGAGHAFLELARMLFENENAGQAEPENRSGRTRVNVLGMTPLDFTAPGQAERLRMMLDENGFETVSVWGIGDSLETLKRAPLAGVNLVVSSAGIAAARYLQEKFGIPYVAGVPTGSFSGTVMQALSQAADTGRSRMIYLEVLEKYRGGAAHAERAVCGEPVTMGSVAAGMALEDGLPRDILCLTETAEGLLGGADQRPLGEEEIRTALSGYREVTADPMLRHACAEGTAFHELAHFAYSGRLYLNRIPPLIG